MSPNVLICKTVTAQSRRHGQRRTEGEAMKEIIVLVALAFALVAGNAAYMIVDPAPAITTAAAV
jgi:hypothetical protein